MVDLSILTCTSICVRDGTYPEGFTKAEKSGLRKRAKFFTIRKGAIYTTLTGSKSSKRMHA